MLEQEESNHDAFLKELLKQLIEIQLTAVGAPRRPRAALQRVHPRRQPSPRDLWPIETRGLRPMTGPGRGHSSLLMSQ